ncbi:hypothetical protein Nmel_003060 [Mimus melanotis]
MHCQWPWEHKFPTWVTAASVDLGGLATPAPGCAEAPGSDPHSSVTAGTSLLVSSCRNFVRVSSTLWEQHLPSTAIDRLCSPFPFAYLQGWLCYGF